MNLKHPFKHFPTYAEFNAAKVSVSAADNQYVQNGNTQSGTPEIRWADIVFIADVGQIWNRGIFYAEYAGLSSQAVRKLSAGYLPLNNVKAAVSLIDIAEQPLTSADSIYKSYPGIRPAVLLYASKDMSRQLQMIADGSDVLIAPSTGSSVYSSSATFSKNQQAIAEDYNKATRILQANSLSSDGAVLLSSATAVAEASYLKQHASFCIEMTTNVGLNTLHHDRYDIKCLQQINTSTTIEDYIDANIGKGTAGNPIWLCLAIDSTKVGQATVQRIVSAINDYVQSGDAIYMQPSDAARTLSPEFNIASETALPFRVYKDGQTDVNLSAASQQRISFSNMSSDYGDKMMSYVVEHFNDKARSLLTDKGYMSISPDGTFQATTSAGDIVIDGHGTFRINENTLKWDATDEANFKQKAFEYIISRVSVESLNEDFIKKLVAHILTTYYDDLVSTLLKDLPEFIKQVQNGTFQKAPSRS